MHASLFLALREGQLLRFWGKVALGARIWVTEVGASPHAPEFSSRRLLARIDDSRSMRMARNGPWNDFGICLSVTTVIVRVVSSSPSVVGLDAVAAFPFQLSLFSNRPFRLRSVWCLRAYVLRLGRCQLSAGRCSQWCWRGSVKRTVEFAVVCPWYPRARSRRLVRVGQRPCNRRAVGRRSGTR